MKSALCLLALCMLAASSFAQEHPPALGDGLTSDTLQDFPVRSDLTPEDGAGVIALPLYPSSGNSDGASV